MPQPTSIKRQHPRVRAGFLVKMQLGSREVLARARDLSMVGLYLDGPLSRLPSEIDLRIPLPGQDRDVVTRCRVERADLEGVAVSFQRIDWNDLIRVARYLSPRL